MLLNNDLLNIFMNSPLLMKVKKGEKKYGLKDIDYKKVKVCPKGFESF